MTGPNDARKVAPPPHREGGVGRTWGAPNEKNGGAKAGRTWANLGRTPAENGPGEPGANLRANLLAHAERLARAVAWLSRFAALARRSERARRALEARVGVSLPALLALLDEQEKPNDAA